MGSRIADGYRQLCKVYALIVGIASAAIYIELGPIADDMGLTLLRLILMLKL
jgi:hypothetical protein